MPKRKSILVELSPTGPITRCDPIPVLITLRYSIGGDPDPDIPAVATAWTATEVLVRPVEWEIAEPIWVPAGDVRRTTGRSPS